MPDKSCPSPLTDKFYSVGGNAFLPDGLGYDWESCVFTGLNHSTWLTFFGPSYNPLDLSTNCRHFGRIMQHVFMMTDPASVVFALKDSRVLPSLTPGEVLELDRKHWFKVKNLHG